MKWILYIVVKEDREERPKITEYYTLVEKYKMFVLWGLSLLLPPP